MLIALMREKHKLLESGGLNMIMIIYLTINNKIVFENNYLDSTKLEFSKIVHSIYDMTIRQPNWAQVTIKRGGSIQTYAIFRAL